MAYSEISVRSAGPVGVITMTEAALGNPLAPEGSEREIQDALMAFQADRDIRQDNGHKRRPNPSSRPRRRPRPW